MVAASRRRLVKLLRTVLEPSAAVFIRVPFLSRRRAVQTAHGRHAPVVIVVARAALERQFVLIHKVPRGGKRVIFVFDHCCRVVYRVKRAVSSIAAVVAGVRDRRRN
ncbi:hypothetical protein H310_10697 [Aphanomyces invadans]|uniref:Uncharacterized protein n=1 Tax=Aphanomyces invadans TaxID=157072 RepID=A0A024TQZ1_9STRA|nr:hypothetical protein H310_10697 [Aphanomyces invadans]ETV96051.1 hypothetical protein H310_10697 [Aphanomyces invadans]|eukprot:XP_008875362.1 hypothetical protein H310_10697 [Aphanomyces invadans]